MNKQTTVYMKICAPTFSILQDERWQEIIRLLLEHRELSVTALTEKLPLSRPVISCHLKLLLGAELVMVCQEGKEQYHQVNLKLALTHLKNLTDSIESDIRQMGS